MVINVDCQILEFIRYKTFFTGRNIMSQKKIHSKEPISCHRKKPNFKERNKLTQEDIYFQIKKYTVKERNILL